jgi:hypothetical protein
VPGRQALMLGVQPGPFGPLISRTGRVACPVPAVSRRPRWCGPGLTRRPASGREQLVNMQQVRHPGDRRRWHLARSAGMARQRPNGHAYQLRHAELAP